MKKKKKNLIQTNKQNNQQPTQHNPHPLPHPHPQPPPNNRKITRKIKTKKIQEKSLKTIHLDTIYSQNKQKRGDKEDSPRSRRREEGREGGEKSTFPASESGSEVVVSGEEGEESEMRKRGERKRGEREGKPITREDGIKEELKSGDIHVMWSISKEK